MARPAEAEAANKRQRTRASSAMKPNREASDFEEDLRRDFMLAFGKGSKHARNMSLKQACLYVSAPAFRSWNDLCSWLVHRRAQKTVSEIRDECVENAVQHLSRVGADGVKDMRDEMTRLNILAEVRRRLFDARHYQTAHAIEPLSVDDLAAPNLSVEDLSKVWMPSLEEALDFLRSPGKRGDSTRAANVRACAVLRIDSLCRALAEVPKNPMLNRIRPAALKNVWLDEVQASLLSADMKGVAADMWWAVEANHGVFSAWATEPEKQCFDEFRGTVVYHDLKRRLDAAESVVCRIEKTLALLSAMTDGNLITVPVESLAQMLEAARCAPGGLECAAAVGRLEKAVDDF
nr:hypothetical protein TetV2_00267 [Oceanusvirus sp.]